jgi:2-amino-4-hydroxy-6-hydroxymethyldihydropteridine diphosphokinase
MSRPQTNARAFVGVGSNIQPEQNIPQALQRLQRVAAVLASSTFCRTEPIGSADQPAFVNGLWEVRTDLLPEQLKRRLHAVEGALGRIRTADSCAPRPIDLDLVIYDEMVCDEPGLTLPHPDLARDFVHAPLLELAPEILEGPLGKAVRRQIGREPARQPAGEPDWPLTHALRAMLQKEKNRRRRKS